MKLSTAYHPQTDGQTEQCNSTLLQMSRGFVQKYHTDWPDHIPALLYAYHNTVHTATGYTPDPHELLFGWSPPTSMWWRTVAALTHANRDFS